MEKLKENKKTIIITSIIILLPILIGLFVWNKLPNEIPTHFDGEGIPNGWSSKVFAVFGFPAFIFICHLVCAFVTCADPRRQQIGAKIFKLILWICPVISWFGAISIYGYSLGWNYNTATAGMILVGIIFIAVGNYLPKCRQNYTVGIKLPWTLHDEENWNRTHRLAGKIWMVGGALFLVLAVSGYGSTMIMPIIMLVMVLVPAVYSYLYYIRHK